MQYACGLQVMYPEIMNGQLSSVSKTAYELQFFTVGYGAREEMLEYVIRAIGSNYQIAETEKINEYIVYDMNNQFSGSLKITDLFLITSETYFDRRQLGGGQYGGQSGQSGIVFLKPSVLINNRRIDFSYIFAGQTKEQAIELAARSVKKYLGSKQPGRIKKSNLGTYHIEFPNANVDFFSPSVFHLVNDEEASFTRVMKGKFPPRSLFGGRGRRRSRGRRSGRSRSGRSSLRRF